ncbi:2-dehydropantoate 2-reductase [Gordonia sp. ABSL11-1]|uniref:ketopantoate reductase family protein n=1 Tax=Gordonia sp. ABSL11-1 TaxID=3053924 RepID=UPI00257467B9|nr:2-dehydropantoate 2-reductase [Gordonia sp. ABSL11-1]MDL9946934.1 2-dehydropantoate 2-reductase [Gordonia sp. ABSL11-1]
MHFVIYGAGAIGGVVGGHLFRAGIPTTVIARGDHLAAIRERGLTLDLAEGAETLAVPAAANASEVEWTDDTVVFICVKSQQTAAVLNDLQAHAPRNTPIVSAQNGVANETAILRRFPRTYSICVMLPALHLEPGVVVQGSSAAPGILDVGRFPGGTDGGISGGIDDGMDDTAEEISRNLRAAGFQSQPRADIMAWKYRKLVLNLGNGIDASYRRDGDAIGELMRRARAEGETVLEAAGIDVVSDAVDKERRGNHIVRRDTGEDSNGSSTWQSVTRGARDSEIDYLTGEIVLQGRLHGVPTPVNELIQDDTARLVIEGREPGSLDPADALERLNGRLAD